VEKERNRKNRRARQEALRKVEGGDADEDAANLEDLRWRFSGFQAGGESRDLTLFCVNGQYALRLSWALALRVVADEVDDVVSRPERPKSS
jgi:hypothetical protein